MKLQDPKLPYCTVRDLGMPTVMLLRELCSKYKIQHGSCAKITSIVRSYGNN